MDLRPVIFVIGVMVTTLGCAMVLPIFVDLDAGEADWQVFAASSLVTLFVGVSLAFATRGPVRHISIKQAFLLTNLSWLAMTAFAALPFVWSDFDINYTDAFFEAMSGITTTGATVLTDLDTAPPGLLLWRSLLQWLGGVGIVVTAIAVLPMLQVGGMQLFRLESSDNSDKILPRVTQIAFSLSAVYLGLTIACAVLYRYFGMTGFDAVNHAMTTIATGGFSTHDQSFGFFGNAEIEVVAIAFMIFGSLPFVLYLQLVRNRWDLFTNTQVGWFFISLCAFIVIAWLAQTSELAPKGWDGFRAAAFNATSIMTGTGYATADYGLWSNFSAVLFMFMMFVGGCAGSTSCGIKIFRFEVIFIGMRHRIRTLRYPRGVFVPLYAGRPLPDSVVSAVMNFLFLFLSCFALLALALGMLGLDTVTALSAAASAIANVGPGLGVVVGPEGNYASLPDSAKWLLSFGMLLGRLELLTVLVLFMPLFWRP